MQVRKYATVFDQNRLPRLTKETEFYYGQDTNMDSPDKISDMLRQVFKLDRLTEEHVFMLAFNVKQTLLGVFEVSHGILNGSFFQPREVFMKALLIGAATIVLAHNHPSGDLEPSKEDIENTKRMRSAGEMIGITLLDSLIISPNGYYRI